MKVKLLASLLTVATLSNNVFLQMLNSLKPVLVTLSFTHSFETGYPTDDNS